MEPVYDRICAKIDLDALKSNLSVIRGNVPDGVKLLAVVKANAYGHGSKKIAGFLHDNVDMFGVAGIYEAIELRKAASAWTAVSEDICGKPVLVLGHTPVGLYEEALAARISLTIYNSEEAELLSEAAVNMGVGANIHIAVDTGMGRIGFYPDEKSADTVACIAKLPGIRIEGVFSHYAASDEADKTLSIRQKELFDKFSGMLKARDVTPEIYHISNSAAIMELEESCDMVRAGIVLYGLYPSEEVKKEGFPLKPVMSLVTRVVNIFDVEAGQGISYGHRFIADRHMRVATLSAGYADGYMRSLSGKGYVLINGMRCNVLGRICMDQMMVDATGLEDIKSGDEALLFGVSENGSISVEEIAAAAGSFNYEFVCGVSRRVPRAYYIAGKCVEVVSYL